MKTNNNRYTRVAIALHWVIALAIFAMLGSGLSLEFIEMEKPFEFQLIQWHKSLGVLVLLAVILRLLWRIFHKPPALPAHIKKFEAVAAKLGHWAIYAFIIIMPVSGWIMVSSSPFGLKTLVFGWFEWPHVPGIASDKAINGAAHEVHEVAAWILLGLIIVHIGAVIKHAVIDRENLLPRMGIGKIK